MKEKRECISKIRIIIAHENKNVCEMIVDAISKLEYVEIVGITTNGIDTYHKIVELKPEMVFIQHNFVDMNSIQLFQKLVEKMQDEVPVLNVIVNEILREELRPMCEISDGKINSLVREPYDECAVNIMEDYIENK